MSNFWESELGTISGTPEDAFGNAIDPIPDGTFAPSKIIAFENKEFMGTQYLQVHWVITEGEYTNRHVFQKIHVFDADPKKRHRALNILKLMYQMFHVKPLDTNPPSMRS